MRKLWCISTLLFFLTNGYAQDRQESLIPGIYDLNLDETPLYYLPKALFQPSNRSVMHIQTAPFRMLQDWGTQQAIVTCDTVDGVAENSIVFLNAQADTSAAAGFVSRQTEPLYFKAMDRTMVLSPSYGDNPLERPQNGAFNFGHNWFSVYRNPQITSRSWKDTEDENRTIEGTTLTIEAAAFRIFRPIPFQSVIYNQTADAIPLYSQADTLNPPQTWFPLNENLFVQKDSLDGLWLKTSRFELVPYERQHLMASDGKTLRHRLKETTGWVRKEDFYRGQWKRHLAELPSCRFEVAGVDPYVADKDGYTATRGVLDAIKVIDKKREQTVQVITGIGAEITDTLNQCLHFVDANFDGYRDIVSAYADGGAGPNYGNIFYLFDPVTKRFVYDEGLSALPQVEVDTVKRVIRSAWRNGVGQHGAAEYRFINGKMEQTYQWNQVWGTGYFVQETESTRQVDGAWKETVSYGAEAVADTVAIYQKPDDRQEPHARVPGSTAYLKIRDEKPLWYYIQIEYPDSLQGWIRKETVFPDNWEQVSTSFTRYTLEKIESEYGNLLALRIRDKKSGEPIQIIGPVDIGYPSGILEAGDDNGDKQLIFRIHFEDDETEPMIYIFDKRRKLFVKGSH